MLHKKFNQDLATEFFKQKTDSCEISLFTFCRAQTNLENLENLEKSVFFDTQGKTEKLGEY